MLQWIRKTFSFYHVTLEIISFTVYRTVASHLLYEFCMVCPYPKKNWEKSFNTTIFWRYFSSRIQLALSNQIYLPVLKCMHNSKVVACEDQWFIYRSEEGKVIPAWCRSCFCDIPRRNFKWKTWKSPWDFT